MNRLWVAQVRGVLRLEMRKNLLSTRALPMYLLAALPVAVTVIFILVTTVTSVPPEVTGPAGAALFFAGLYQFILDGALLRLRLDLHEPVPRRGAGPQPALLLPDADPPRGAGRRQVRLGLGHHRGAVLRQHRGLFRRAATATWGLGHGRPARAARALAHWRPTSGVTLLGCLGYGAVFLLVGLFFRNPIVPALRDLGLWNRSIRSCPPCSRRSA